MRTLTKHLLIGVTFDIEEHAKESIAIIIETGLFTSYADFIRYTCLVQLRHEFDSLLEDTFNVKKVKNKTRINIKMPIKLVEKINEYAKKGIRLDRSKFIRLCIERELELWI